MGHKLRTAMGRTSTGLLSGNVEATAAVIGEGQREILRAMAKSTGKTKTCVALFYRLLKTGRFRRAVCGGSLRTWSIFGIHQGGTMCAKLFRNGRSQAVRLPAEFRFEGSEVEVQRDPETGAVVLTPVRPSARAWLQERNVLMQQPGIHDEILELLGNLRDPSAPQERGLRPHLRTAAL